MLPTDNDTNDHKRLLNLGQQAIRRNRRQLDVLLVMTESFVPIRDLSSTIARTHPDPRIRRIVGEFNQTLEAGIAPIKQDAQETSHRPGLKHQIKPAHGPSVH